MIMCIEKINTHKDIMKEVERLSKEHDLVIKSLASFNGANNEPISRDSLLAFPLFVWTKLNDKVKIRRRKNLFGKILNFDTEFKRGGEFGKHFHDDMIESSEVISGLMLDEVDDKEYAVGDVMHYEKGQHHKPVALRDTVLRVLFK